MSAEAHKREIVLDSAYTPSPWGQEFHALTHDYALGAGSAGPGKSMVLLMEPFSQIIIEHERCYHRRNHDFPLNWGESSGWALHLRRTLPMLQQTLARAHRIFPAIDPGVAWNATQNAFVFSSGYRYQFGHCHDIDSWQQFYSSEYTIILYDELTQFLEEQWDQINTRLRSSDPVLRRMVKIRAMSNPVTKRESNYTLKDPFWVRRLFVDPAREGRKTILKKSRGGDGRELVERWIYLPATLYDNPDKEFVASYERRLVFAKPHLRQALLYGDWYFTEGSFFQAWDQTVHVIKGFKIPEHWPVFRSMDWGFKKPGCVHWWAMDEDENLFCFHELTFNSGSKAGTQTDEDVAKLIKEIEQNYGYWKNGKSILTGPADTQLWEKRGENVLSKAETMLKLGIQWVAAEKRNKPRNCEIFSKRLADYKYNSEHPGVSFFERCEMAIKTIPSAQTKTDGPDRLEVFQDGGDDHWIDSVLYACAYASHGRAGIQKKSDDDDEDDDDMKSVRENRGRDGYGSTV